MARIVTCIGFVWAVLWATSAVANPSLVLCAQGSPCIADGSSDNSHIYTAAQVAGDDPIVVEVHLNTEDASLMGYSYSIDYHGGLHVVVESVVHEPIPGLTPDFFRAWGTPLFSIVDINQGGYAGSHTAPTIDLEKITLRITFVPRRFTLRPYFSGGEAFGLDGASTTDIDFRTLTLRPRCGDANGDDTVDSADAAHVRSCLAGAFVCPRLCDANNDGECSIEDARLIDRVVAQELIPEQLACFE